MKLTIVIPCYNEADRLSVQEISEFKTKHSDVEILLVNDGSTDETLSLISGIQIPGISVLNLKENVGKAEAVRQGILHTSAGQSQYIGYFDADFSTPLNEAISFLEIIRARPEVQVVIGSRIKRMGATIDRLGYRHFIGRLFATCASNILTLGIYDTQCGAKIIKASLLEKVVDKPFKTRWLFDVELIARIILVIGYKKTLDSIYEYPLNRWKEVGKSKISFSNMIKFPHELLMIYFRYHRAILKKRDDEDADISG